MNDARRRVATVATIVVFALLLKAVWNKVNFIVWTNVPWWGVILVFVLAYFVIEYLVTRALGKRGEPQAPKGTDRRRTVVATRASAHRP